MGMDTLVPPRRAEESEPHHPCHVEGSEEGGDHADAPQHGPRAPAVEDGAEDLVLGPEPGEGRDPGNGQPGDCHRGERGGALWAPGAPLPPVLLAPPPPGPPTRP